MKSPVAHFLALCCGMLLAAGCTAPQSPAEKSGEEARMLARNDAREIIHRQWADSLTLRTALDTLRAHRNDSMLWSPEIKLAYDTTLVNTVRAARHDCKLMLRTYK